MHKVISCVLIAALSTRIGAAMRLFTLVTVLLLSMFVAAQEVTPSSFNFGQITVGQSSPPARMTFKNTGDSELELSVSITGPFAIPVNDCGRGVKVRTHCDVYITYTPTGLETDSGTLTFSYGQGESSISIAGTGVSEQVFQYTVTNMPPGGNNPHGDVYIPPTGGNVGFLVVLKTTQYEMIPNGELVYVTCQNSGSTAVGSGPTQMDHVYGVGIFIDKEGEWTCRADYPGDSQFQASQSRKLSFNVIFRGIR